MSPRRWIAVGLAIAAVAVIAVAVSISSGSSSPAIGPPQLGGANVQQFQSCMAQHGAQPPGPGGPTPSQGAPSAAQRRALQACSQYLPSGGFGRPPAGAPLPGASSG
jgi:hypothetical protein